MLIFITLMSLLQARQFLPGCDGHNCGLTMETAFAQARAGKNWIKWRPLICPLAVDTKFLRNHNEHILNRSGRSEPANDKELCRVTKRRVPWYLFVGQLCRELRSLLRSDSDLCVGRVDPCFTCTAVAENDGMISFSVFISYYSCSLK